MKLCLGNQPLYLMNLINCWTLEIAINQCVDYMNQVFNESSTEQQN